MSLAVVDISDPASMKLIKLIPTGVPIGGNVQGGSSPSGVIATESKIYVSNAHNDSVSVIDARTLVLEAEIPLRAPGLESLRGVMPMGLAIYNDWLLVAEAGINAIGVIDTRTRKVLGHIPSGWFPTRIVIDRGMMYISNAKGHGTGPNADRVTRKPTDEMRRGSISMLPVPAADDLKSMTQRVWRNNGFVTAKEPAQSLPPDLKYVVIIVKENRTFDEVLGDMTAANGVVAGDPELARYGEHAPRPHRTRRLAAALQPETSECHSEPP